MLKYSKFLFVLAVVLVSESAVDHANGITTSNVPSNVDSISDVVDSPNQDAPNLPFGSDIEEYGPFVKAGASETQTSSVDDDYPDDEDEP